MRFRQAPISEDAAEDSLSQRESLVEGETPRTPVLTSNKPDCARSQAAIETLGFAACLGYPLQMTETESDLLHALLDLENTVLKMPTANPKPSLLPLFTRIDELTRQLPRATDPSLLHYLHKKSYEKARLFLEGQSAEKGTCGK